MGVFDPLKFYKMTLLSSENELAHEVEPKNRVNRTVTMTTKKMKFCH